MLLGLDDLVNMVLLGLRFLRSPFFILLFLCGQRVYRTGIKESAKCGKDKSRIRKEMVRWVSSVICIC